jgi:NMD protein affecting ribosome stability and mRNA decay
MMSEPVKLLLCPFCGSEAEFERHGTNRQSSIVACQQCGARVETGETWNEGQLWNTRSVPAAGTLPDRERLAEIMYTACHKGLRNCWKWSDAELDNEHPTSRGYWYKIADGTLATIASSEQETGK